MIRGRGRSPLRLLILVVGALSAPAALQGQAATGAAPEAASRPDSLRALVLARVREQASPAPADSLADSLRAAGAAEPMPRAGGGAALPAKSREPVGAPELPAGADSIMRALLDLPGFNSAAYSGARADFNAADRTLVLWGNEDSRAFFSGQGNQVEADSSITYSDEEERIRTHGATDLTSEESDPLRSQMLIYDLRAERGTAVGAETTYSQGAQWIVSGNLDSVEQNRLFGSSARFTTCDLPDPHSYFQASELKVVRDQVLVARSVKMYIADVPVLWLPFIAQNLGSGRASGILTPVFSVNDIVRTAPGYNRRISNVGYYWAMSDYSDATVALDWFSGNYTALQGALRYQWARQFLSGRLNVKQYWGTGRQELGLDTSHQWEISERTSLRASGRYITHTDFVRQNSLDPRESTGTIDSDANLTRRFDWGRLTLGASHKQYLNEDNRTESTLPSASLALSTLTLFGAPPQTARWYNNLALSGSMSFDRQIEDRASQPDSTFNFASASKTRTDAAARGSLSLGDLSLSGSLSRSETVFGSVPENFFSAPEDVLDGIALPGGRGDFRSAEMNWSAGLSYQINLIGSTTLTPNLNFDGRMLQVDSIAEARSFVGGPTRFRAGVRLQTDIYGFYPGFGPFEAIRHKITPSVSWSYAPEVVPTDLQALVFGPQASRTQNLVTIGLNQTWEARAPQEQPEVLAAPAAAPGAAPETAADTIQIGAVPSGAAAAGAPDAAGGQAPGVVAGQTSAFAPTAGSTPFNDDGLTRLPPSRVVTLLALQTSAIAYDIVQADSTGHFLDGFTTVSLTNRVSSDYLRGLNLSFTHDLFDDSGRSEGGARRFSPRLTQLSLGFNLSDDSGLLRAIGGLFGIEPRPDTAAAPANEPVSVQEPLEEPIGDPLNQVAGFNPDRVVPGGEEQGLGTQLEGWQASFSYALTRPRVSSSAASSLRSQMLRSQISFSPSEHWRVDWSTSYDLEAKRFNDHTVNLTRDLHEWEARFGFIQTATGNWSFQFQVALRADRDLKFDYQQRSLELDRTGF